jgi:hypothetical protein
MDFTGIVSCPQCGFESDDVDLEIFKADEIKIIKGVVEKNNSVENMEELKNLED